MVASRKPPVGRPRLPGGKGRQAVKYSVSSFPAAEKLKVLAHLTEHRNIRLTINKFYPTLPKEKYQSRQTFIQSWKAGRTNIEQLNAEQGGADKRKVRPASVGTVLPPFAEKLLVEWVNELRAEGVPVTTMMLKLKALSVAKRYSVPTFEASWSCQDRFKARHRLSMRARTRQGQITPPDLTKIAADFAEEKTIEKKGAKTVWVKCAGKEKERASAMLLGDSMGNKFTPFVVFKAKPSQIPECRELNDKNHHGFSIIIWRQMRPAQKEKGIEVYGNEKGWWNTFLSLEFLKFHFGDRPVMEDPILVLWGDFSGHWFPDVVSYANKINVHLMKVPPNATSVAQPADRSGTDRSRRHCETCGSPIYAKNWRRMPQEMRSS
ncbi:hypothetical protein PR003_g9301 [Phytophthora rubi]|uniref:HTH CENPB-type domain-containing protein n=1 Tax=Phytophthora rubi TaxID=129364 RepID=A0A6A4FNH9_9STRA|nr:hypothetical protein PR001_g9242 [Phytophthora rubi]KAE9342784.1 hypothetical protein PR003_g9301 [Phytophthora rubi]